MTNPLQSFMDRNKLNDAKAAELLGWHPAHVSKVRRDKHVSLSLKTACDLERVTGVPASEWHKRFERNKSASSTGEAA